MTLNIFDHPLLLMRRLIYSNSFFLGWGIVFFYLKILGSLSFFLNFMRICVGVCLLLYICFICWAVSVRPESEDFFPPPSSGLCSLIFFLFLYESSLLLVRTSYFSLFYFIFFKFFIFIFSISFWRSLWCFYPVYWIFFLCWKCYV